MKLKTPTVRSRVVLFFCLEIRFALLGWSFHDGTHGDEQPYLKYNKIAINERNHISKKL